MLICSEHLVGVFNQHGDRLGRIAHQVADTVIEAVPVRPVVIGEAQSAAQQSEEGALVGSTIHVGLR